MDRQKRTASRVTDFRKYHLSGDLDKVVQGKVSAAVDVLENVKTPTMSHIDIPEESSPEQLQDLLREQKESSSRIEQQLEAMKIRNELERERMQQAEWELAIQQMKEAREWAAQQHEENLSKIRAMGQEASTSAQDKAVHWLQTQLTGPQVPEKDKEEQKREQLDKLRKQQEEIQRQIEDLTGGEPHQGGPTPTYPTGVQLNQELLLEQIKATLKPKESNMDPNKAMLKALISSHNKTLGAGGASTLRPDIFNKLTGEGEFSMAEWLASLNRQEEGESEVTKLLSKADDDLDCRADCRHSKTRSGMLDKSTSNIRHKEVWPQKNLGEDWADEELEFKQLRFKHLVAGETRTIETCTNPAQILGRLRLLRRISYLKLRGMEWNLLRKMYAAILSSIETREYSWESNFDRFETILYRKAMTEKNQDREGRENKSEGRKRFRKDYNKPEGCPKSSPHTAWLGSGPGATKRQVFHCCAVCSYKDRVARSHPEGHPDCPHRT